jgi:serine/threonine protein kinase/TPR repeat protein
MQAPERLGKYVIRRELGRGAMGVVYEGYDPMIERSVALKVLRLDEGNAELAAELRMRFRREAQAAGRLGHPGIVAIHEYGEDAADGTAFIAMELVRGRDLKSAFDAGTRFTLEETGRLMADLLAALQHAHERGVVHRDIKPGNIILLDGGGVKVADFGIARLDTSELTQFGSVLGTVSHMAPEQLTGAAVDGRSDLYSCGVILYQLLTGERPFSGPPASLMHKVLHEQPIPPSQRAPGLTAALDAVVLKAMAKEPSQRHADARAFAAALRRALAEPRLSTGAPSAADDATVVLPRGSAGGVAASATAVDATLPSPRASSPPSPSPSPSPSASASASLPASPPPSPTPSTSDAPGRGGARRIGVAVLAALGVVGAGVAAYRIFILDRAGEPTGTASMAQSSATVRPTVLADLAPPPPAAGRAEPETTTPELAPAAPAPPESAPVQPLSGVAPALPPALALPPTGAKPVPAVVETEPKRPSVAAIAPRPERPARTTVPAEPARRAPPALAPETARPVPIAPTAPGAARVPAPPAVAAASEARSAAAETAPAAPRIAKAHIPAPTSSAAAPFPARAPAERPARDDPAYGGAGPIAPLLDAPARPAAPRVEARIAPADAVRPSRAPASAPDAATTRPRVEPDCLDDARRGNVRCQIVVGNLYRAGRGVPRDPAEAARWYRMAAEQGSDAGQYELGVMHENGLGVVRNPREAVAWYRRAAVQGHARAQNQLGRAYENGLAGQPNLVLAADWYRKAAEQNLPIAEYNLGRLYLAGRGVFKDAAKGQALLQKAAEAGEPNAMVYVAEMYARAEGKPHDRDQAARLYREALGRAGLTDRNRQTAERALASTR